MANPPRWLRIATLTEVPNGGFQCVEVEGVSVLVCRLNQDAYAVVNNCPHQNQRMDDAAMFEYEIVCPHHNACFDVRSGKRLSGPSIYPLGGYPCRVVDGAVEVDAANPESSLDRHMQAVMATPR